MPKITPHLWFDRQAEEAVAFYTSIFPNSRTGTVVRYTDEVAEVAGMPVGTILNVDFELDGQQFIALNGGAMFQFTEAISLMIMCKDQAEIDHYWNGLSEGGEIQMCGWLKDKYGLSWQVVPEKLGAMIHDPDPDKSRRVMAKVMEMKKFDIAELDKAYSG